MNTFLKNINWKIVLYWTIFMSFFNVFLLPYYDGEAFLAKKSDFRNYSLVSNRHYICKNHSIKK